MRNVGFHIATLVTAVITSLLAWGSDPETAWMTVAALGGIVVVQWGLARWLFDHPHRLASVFFIVAMGVAVAVACYGSPMAAFFQFAAYPMMWATSRSVSSNPLLGGIAGSAVVALGCGLGISHTWDWFVAAATALMALVVSVVIGTWITYWTQLAKERARLIEQLQAAEESSRTLERQAGQQVERERIARDIHDTITQNLTGIVMAAQQAGRHAESRESAETFAVIERLAADGLADARALASGQHSANDSGELEPTVQRLASDFERETGVRVHVHAALNAALDTETRVVLLRCAQESLANVRKHAHARSVRIELSSSEPGACLVVVDDGVGMTKAEPPGPGEGRGITSMTERVALTGGTVSIEDNQPGTIVRVQVPISGRSDFGEVCDD